MKQRKSIVTMAIRILWILFLPWFFFHATALAASSSAGEPDRIKSITVMIKSSFREININGAGILFGMKSGWAYIATANHVVRLSPPREEVAQAVKVRFWDLPGRWLDADLLSDYDHDLDLAVLTVDVNRYKTTFQKLLFNQLGDLNSLASGNLVRVVGQPDGKLWKVRVTPDRFTNQSGHTLNFEAQFLAPGHSGGALINDRNELIGMVIREETPEEAQAISIDRVVEKLVGWNYPVDLKRSIVFKVLPIDPGALPVKGLPAPRLVSPRPGSVFGHYPRTTQLSWQPVSGAGSYKLEIQFGDPAGTQWANWKFADVKGTTYLFDFVGRQPGRWRVWAVDSKGVEGRKSEWWDFRYTK